MNELMNQKRKGYSVLQKQKVISSDICAAFLRQISQRYQIDRVNSLLFSVP